MGYERLSVSVTPQQAQWLETMGESASELLQEEIKNRMKVMDKTIKELTELARKVRVLVIARDYINEKLQGSQFESLVTEAILHANATEHKERDIEVKNSLYN